MRNILLAIALLIVTSIATAESKDINIGVILSTTGQAADMGIPPRDAVTMLPKMYKTHKINYTVLDDGSDPTKAVTNARKLTMEYNVDAILGPTITPTSLAIMDIARETGTPVISEAGSIRIVSPLDDKRKWMFKVSQNDSDLIASLIANMKKQNVKSVGWIGFNNAFGESWWDVFKGAAEANNITITTKELFNPGDVSTTAQVVKVLATKPDAVLIVGAGTPALLPHLGLKSMNYKGNIYHTHGSVSDKFIQLGGAAVEGTIAPTGPITVAAELSPKHKSKAEGLKFTQLYENAFGPGKNTNKASLTWDAWHVVSNSLGAALAKAEPGTPAFRKALRDSIETTKELALTHGIMNLSATDHSGWDSRSVVLVQVVNGKWKLLSE